MAKPVTFDEANVPFVGEHCLTLPVKKALEPIQVILKAASEIPHLFEYGNTMVSCWQLSENELHKLRENGGRIYLHCVGLQPPVYVTSLSPTEETLIGSPLNDPQT